MKSKTLLACLCALGFVLSPIFVQAKTADTLTIVATSYHEFDWISHIIQGQEKRFSVKLLLDKGVDLHNYQPTTRDVALISTADMFIYNGGLSDSWAEDIVKDPLNPDLVAVNIMERLGDAVKMEVAVEGMQKGGHAHGHAHDKSHDAHEGHGHKGHDGHAHKKEHDNHKDHNHAKHEKEHGDHEGHNHKHEKGHDHEGHDHAKHEKGHDDHKGYTAGHEDEHVWLSLKNAEKICEILEDAISAIDPEHKKMYEKNTQAYVAQLRKLDKQFRDELAGLPQKSLVFTDRFPFLYLLTDYGIAYHAAFQGCSAETEASFETIAFLSKKVNDNNANYVLIIDNGLDKLATTVINNSKNPKAQILTLNSLQSVTRKDIESGKTYISMMKDNLEVLKKALQ